MTSKLLQRFLGKRVSVIMNHIKGSQQLSTGDIVEGNVVMSGILLDEDDEFYYLGSTEEEIDEALKKADVVRVYIDKDDEFEIDMDDDGVSH